MVKKKKQLKIKQQKKKKKSPRTTMPRTTPWTAMSRDFKQHQEQQCQRLRFKLKIKNPPTRLKIPLNNPARLQMPNPENQKSKIKQHQNPFFSNPKNQKCQTHK